MMLVGSTALKYHFPDFNRNPKDLDFIVRDKSQFKSTKEVEYLPLAPLLDYYPQDDIISKEGLLTLKLSHSFWDINYEKHLYDIQFLFAKGVKYDEVLFYELYNFWINYHGELKRSNLQMKKDAFFDNALKEYDHDYLHTLIKNPPTYLSMLDEEQEVNISKDLFMSASEEDKKNLIKEEVMNMAFERFQKMGYKGAYSKMLKKYLQLHAPLYVAIWAYENYNLIYKADYDFVIDLKQKLGEL